MTDLQKLALKYIERRANEAQHYLTNMCAEESATRQKLTDKKITIEQLPYFAMTPKDGTDANKLAKCLRDIQEWCEVLHEDINK